MRARLPWSSPTERDDEHPEIAPLDADAALAMRLPWLSHFNTETLQAHLAQHPGHSLWIPSTGEYVVAGSWRGRPDIAQLVEVTARRGKSALLQGIVDLTRRLGYELLLMSDEVWGTDRRAFEASGFKPVERIVFFHLELRRRDIPAPSSQLPQLQFTQKGLRDLDLLLDLDHGSFPWLWWNSREEFMTYINLPDVRVIVAEAGDQPIGYASFTMYKGWAHLDRLAVVAAEQGRGYGAAQLYHVLGMMRSLGADSVNLSTQEDNTRSHRLYKSFGFRQTTEKMSFYGYDLQ